METRQLSYFILACQYKNHAEAAARSGVSASALSENLNLLERELGLTLFQRGPFGHYPTEVARWLYQSVEPALQAVEAAETVLRRTKPAPLRRLEVTSPLRFMMGRPSRAASLAARALREVHPDVFAAIRFASGDGVFPQHEGKETGAAAANQERAGHVALEYADDDGNPESTLLFSDEWVCITAVDRIADLGRAVEFETLRKLPLLLPLMLPSQIRQARAYCAQHDLPEPKVVEEDVGTFPRLSRDTSPFCLLAPQSLVAEGLARLNLGHARLPAVLASLVVARIVEDDAAARSYVSLLKTIIQDPEPIVSYQPRITMKQMRYFLMLRDHLNVTAAARKLHVVQPALSNQLRKLEDLVGKTLFRRHRTGLEPTRDTQILADLLAPALAQCDQVAFHAAHYAAEQHQRLSIGFIPMINHDGPLLRAITGALEEWMGTYPRVKLQVLEAPTQILHRWVESGATSFALVEAHVSRISQLDLNTRDVFGVVSSRTEALLPAGEVTLRHAAELPLVLPGETFGLRQILDRAAAEADVRLSPHMEINSLTMILALVRRMPFATILPEPSVQPYVDAGIFQFNPIAEPTVRRRLSILFSAGRQLTEIERALIGIFRRHLALAGFSPSAASDSAPDGARPSRTKVH